MSVVLYNKSGDARKVEPKQLQSILSSNEWFLTRDEAKGYNSEHQGKKRGRPAKEDS